MGCTIGLAQFPGGGSSRMETNAYVVTTVRKMDRDPRIREVVSLTYCGTPIPMLRNRAVREAQSSGCQYLLMVDADMDPDAVPGNPPFWETAWEFLARRDDALPPATIAAPYCGPPPDELCYVFSWTDHESDTPDFASRLEMISREHAATKAGIEEVSALPTGLILYDMRVFDLMPPPWFQYEYEDRFQSSLASTEDVFQTRDASLLGLPQYCAWDCWSAHMKMKRVGRPWLVTRDQVQERLREAIVRGIDRGDRLVILPKLNRNGNDLNPDPEGAGSHRDPGTNGN